MLVEEATHDRDLGMIRAELRKVLAEDAEAAEAFLLVAEEIIDAVRDARLAPMEGDDDAPKAW